MMLESFVEIFNDEKLYDKYSIEIEGMISKLFKNSSSKIFGNAKEVLFDTKLHDAYLISTRFLGHKMSGERIYGNVELIVEKYDKTYKVTYESVNYLRFRGNLLMDRIGFPPSDSDFVAIAQILNIWIVEGKSGCIEMTILLDSNRCIEISSKRCEINAAKHTVNG